MVDDLQATRIGDKVQFQWTTPSLTTDDFVIKGALTAELCRMAPSGKALLQGAGGGCVPILRLAVAPGSSTVSESLTAALKTDPVSLMAYRIQILSAAGRSAGVSFIAAFAASGEAPPPLESLEARNSERGIILDWETTSARSGPAGTFPAAADFVEFSRTSEALPTDRSSLHRSPALQIPGRKRGATASQRPASEVGEVRLREHDISSAGQAPSGGQYAGMVDSTVKLGQTYTYIGERVRVVDAGGHHLEIRGAPSAPLSLTVRDTFPPASPTGLATIPGAGRSTRLPSGSNYIDLSWEPNVEPDFAGYIIYRVVLGADGRAAGPAARLNATPVLAPAFRDVAAEPGQRYSYSVTAVDASGNESAPSTAAEESIPATR